MKLTHHARGSVVCGDVFCQIVPGEGLDIFCGPQNGAAEGAVLESCGVQMVKYHLLWNAFHLQVVLL